MNSHLVTIKVRVESGTSKRVELNCLALYHLWLECLNTKSVKGRGTVKQYRVSLHHILQNIPYYGIFPIYNLLCRFYGLNYSALYEFSDNEWFVELCSHIFRKSALVHLKFRTNHNNRTGRVVHTFTQEVLTETSLLSFKTVGEGFQRPVGLCLNGIGLSGVVEERVNSLLEHTLLISENYLRSLNLYESLKTVVSYDYPSVEVVKV